MIVLTSRCPTHNTHHRCYCNRRSTRCIRPIAVEERWVPRQRVPRLQRAWLPGSRSQAGRLPARPRERAQPEAPGLGGCNRRHTVRDWLVVLGACPSFLFSLSVGHPCWFNCGRRASVLLSARAPGAQDRHGCPTVSPSSPALQNTPRRLSCRRRPAANRTARSAHGSHVPAG